MCRLRHSQFALPRKNLSFSLSLHQTAAPFSLPLYPLSGLHSKTLRDRTMQSNRRHTPTVEIPAPRSQVFSMGDRGRAACTKRRGTRDASAQPRGISRAEIKTHGRSAFTFGEQEPPDLLSLAIAAISLRTHPQQCCLPLHAKNYGTARHDTGTPAIYLYRRSPEMCIPGYLQKKKALYTTPQERLKHQERERTERRRLTRDLRLVKCTWEGRNMVFKRIRDYRLRTRAFNRRIPCRLH